MGEVIPFPITPRVRQLFLRARALASRADADRVDVDHLFLALETQSGSPVRAMVHDAGYDVGALWAAFRGASRVVAWHEDVAEDEFIGGLGI
jgi:ATP-dependent Clp protease ATP-binding subunit ClpA